MPSSQTYYGARHVMEPTSMHRKTWFGVAILLLLAITMTTVPVSADTLVPDDFKLQSFSKTIDFMDFVRANAARLGQPLPSENAHAYLYQVYINVSGFQLYYSGLSNLTDEQNSITAPVQNFMEHYKTANGETVLTSSSFIMLLAFNDTANSIYPNSPDRNDTLYASFSLGLDLNTVFGSENRPALSTRTTILPMNVSSDKLQWQWGMRYNNLTAVWWRMYTDPSNPRYAPLPVAITTYDELTFTYNLNIDQSTGKATLSSNYVIGRMTNLWLIQWLIIIPVVVHYNSTGAYTTKGVKLSGETIHQFLTKQQIKMSIVLFQNSLTLNQSTKSTYNNQNVTDAELDVSKGTVTTSVGNDKIFETNFGAKQKYSLYNITDGSKTQYDAVTRTTSRAGYARNPLFNIHVALLRYIPMIVAHIDPAIYEKAKDHITSMEYSDCLYVISYPTYGGYKVVHDPTFTAYAALTAQRAASPYGLILFGGVVAAGAVGAVYIVKRRRSRTVLA
jgi:hypothetical protein